MNNIIGTYHNSPLTTQASPLFSASDHRFPYLLRGYWKQVEWSAYDLVWDILPDAFQAGWEHEHLLRNVGSRR